MLNRPLRIRDAVRVRPIAQRATVPWPKGCPGYRLVEEPAEVGTIVALTTAADLWPDADDRDVVGDVMVAAVLWDGLASQLADDAGDGMPEVATWLIPVDALELAIGPVVDLPELDLSDDLRLHLAASRAIAATRLAIAVQLRDRAAELEAARRESNTQRAINVRVARVLRGIADDVEAGTLSIMYDAEERHVTPSPVTICLSQYGLTDQRTIDAILAAILAAPPPFVVAKPPRVNG